MSSIDFDSLRDSLTDPTSLVFDPERLEAYEHDETFLRGKPIGLVMASSAKDVLASVKFCLKKDLAVVPRGAGTGLSGGCVPADGSLVVSTELIDQLEIFPQDKIAICGPGVITKDLQDQVAMFELTYPPDPASYEESTLGGNVAENAGGLRCKRYGVTKDYVLGLEAITGDGELIKTGCFNDRPGFAIGDLLIGSEGTLAIITKMALRLIDLPGRGHTILIAFDKPENAARAVTEITTSGLIPTALEFLDGHSVRLSNEYEKTEGIEQAEGVLLIETTEINPELQTTRIRAIAEKNKCSFLRIEPDPVKAETLWAVRRNMAKAAKAAAKIKLSEDVAVPNSKFPEMVAFVATLNKSPALRLNAYGHAGDGNLHANLLADSDSPETMQLIDQTVRDILKKAIKLGGTLSGEHGIGLTKREFLPLEFDRATLAFMTSVKELFDPVGIMNPGKLFAGE